VVEPSTLAHGVLTRTLVVAGRAWGSVGVRAVLGAAVLGHREACGIIRGII
jgi:hypothetical protein